MNDLSLEVLADDAAVLTNQGQRFGLSGTFGREIVTGYRHALECPEGGGQAAAVWYLWGVLHGLRYSIFDGQLKLLDEIEGRRLDRTTKEGGQG